MLIADIADVVDMRAAGGTAVGLDLGTKTIGVAVSDLGWGLANPRPVIRRAKFQADATTLSAFLASVDARLVVIGLPLNMDGSEGPRSQSTRAFVRNFQRIDPRPFVFWDERLSTVAAERSLLEMDVSRRQRAERIDSAAASFILQGALDRLSRLTELRDE
ncbi:Holliday junction resolvase RuvX [Aureimonas phyllosphaerae]|uniref:Putative pre-16S rRNA nuclease n=1 Tax=Aureimonas phyllosphaerae TaxID=1166078 RepID=A0A7W6FTT6_9HYPH|nr:Holliday junction resolvase RuvX [Aureimonas phyllosphaerae]MBB3935356.1 putative Holliday junction resolvase [Aureimonas phyllosphaerae]MBB3959364.1 putative Holliday junction resolvase [Aureimonas phyllosphaerae]SFF04100.1 putative holliday junction resolvase [Aureimonas phyllosphaerae]